MSAIFDAASGALAGIGQAVGTVLGVVKGAKTTSKALGIQRDLGNRQIDLAEQQTQLVAQQADKEREADNYKLNTLVQLWTDQSKLATEQQNADRELTLALAPTSTAGTTSPVLLFGLAAVILFMVFRAK